VSNNSAAHDTIEALADMFPACFSVFQGRRRPLKIGIHNDLIAALAGAISEKEARLALAVYTGNPAYLRACCNVGAARVDLVGNKVGSVDLAAATHAKQRLDQQRDKRKRREEAMAQAKAAAEAKARNAGRIGLADLRRAAQARRTAAIAAE
jgi:sRNA-binding protein